MLAFNFFFLPPVGDLHDRRPAELGRAVRVSRREPGRAATCRPWPGRGPRKRCRRGDELARLFDLSRDVLLITESREALSAPWPGRSPGGSIWTSSRSPCRAAGEWESSRRGAARRARSRAARPPRSRRHRRRWNSMRTPAPMSGIGRWRWRAARCGWCRCASAPSRSGCSRPPAVPVEPGTLDALAGVVGDRHRAGAVPRRAQGRRADAPERRAEDGAPRVARPRSADAADRDPRRGQQPPGGRRSTDAERREQSDLILAEVERLTRLFQNILEMARIDAGAVATETRWAHPSEIIAAARDQVEHTLRGHPLQVDHRSGRTGPPRPAADRGRARTCPRERGAVLAAGIDD